MDDGSSTEAITMITKRISGFGEGRRRSLGTTAVLSVGLILTFAFGVPAFAAGGLDPTFGAGGKVTTVFPGGSYANAVAIQPDGKIVAVGAAAGPSVSAMAPWSFALVRYLP
jgi:hypothetical protein